MNRPLTLHVTNGDSVAGSLRVTGIPGEILPWRDILHEGPVPLDLSPGQLRETRARFIADQGWGGYQEVLRDFETRVYGLKPSRSSPQRGAGM